MGCDIKNLKIKKKNPELSRHEEGPNLGAFALLKGGVIKGFLYIKGGPLFFFMFF